MEKLAEFIPGILYRVEHPLHASPIDCRFRVGPYHRMFDELGDTDWIKEHTDRRWHPALWYDPNFQRNPYREEFFGFGSPALADLWFFGEAKRWLRKHDFLLVKYACARVAHGVQQSIVDTKANVRRLGVEWAYAEIR